jgi:hypothetical protein
VQESQVGASSSSPGDVATGLLPKGYRTSVGDVVGGWPNLAQSSLGGGGRRWRVKIRELEMLGCGPGRWATADGFINFDSAQSLCAMGPLLLVVVFGFFVITCPGKYHTIT